ncbi:hypothetical protein CAC42_7686 [Sphaceloma murrayae]|uniref:Nuclear pore complex protein n=1 Tax=Sphaceloma murrayae TaxID=2082308 RepID=A0A2K1QXI3_9PEZI|nr:hypothetical protein CAC42_7686 [Sphaceloma murrayae]
MAPISKSSRTAGNKPITRKRHASRSQPLSDSGSDSDSLPPQQTTSSLFRPKSTTLNTAFFTSQPAPFTGSFKNLTTQQEADGTDEEEAEDEEEDLDLSSLANIASRVGAEVDLFAETLDQFRDALQKGGDGRDAAMEVVTRWRDWAVDRVERARREGWVKGIKDMVGRGSVFTDRSKGDGQGQDDKEIKRWVAEADTWDLLRVMLKARYPGDAEREERRARQEEVGNVHKYSPKEDVWAAFVLGDDVAKERHLVLKWLERAGETEEVGEKEKSMWVNGWMETRERVKGAKRMRLNEDAEVHVRSGNEILVSALDPDAPTRQKKTLEKGDTVRDKEMWEACFYMLRKGKTWDEVTEWIAQRNQGWRAASLGVTASKILPVGAAGPASGALWRRMCLIAARTGTTDDFEAAVYGLLSGDLDSVKRVCRTWNDHVFAHYNAMLMAQFDDFTLQFNILHLPLDFVRKNALGSTSQITTTQSSQDLVSGLSKLPSLAKELRQPFKLLQGSLVGNTFSDLARKVGMAIAEAAWKEEPSVVIKPVHRSAMTNSEEGLVEGVISDDPDALRVTTHALSVLRAVDPLHFTEASQDELDNVIAGYIQLLRVAGKRDMTPLYASLMAEERCVASLSQVITDDEDAKDRMDFIRLMQVYDIDAIAVIKGQYMYQLDRVLAAPVQTSAPLDIIETTKEELYPGKRVKLSGIDVDITPDEEGLITGLSVFYLIEGHWSVTFEALASACSKLLAQGNFPAALALTAQLQFDQLSLSKSASILGRAINVMSPDHTALVLAGDPGNSIKLQIMRRESQSYYHMSLLTRAVEALCAWRQVEHEATTKIPRPTSTPSKLRKAIEEVRTAVEPLLQGILVDSRDDEEAKSFRTIKQLYLPDIIIGYLSALCSAGHMVSRDELLTAMEVSTTMAGDEKNGLARAFRDAGRMKELVKVFAEASRIMLKLGEVGRKRPQRQGKGRERDLGIWEIYG